MHYSYQFMPLSSLYHEGCIMLATLGDVGEFFVWFWLVLLWFWYLQPLTDLPWDVDDSEVPKYSRLCLVMFAWNTMYRYSEFMWLHQVCDNHTGMNLHWISLIFDYIIWNTYPVSLCFAADSVFELDSSTESAEASPEVSHRVRRSGVMARRGTPSR